MGFFDRFRRQPSPSTVLTKQKRQIAVAASQNDVSSTYAERQITFSGTLAGYDYRAILKSKQKNIQRLFELADYYCDADPICRGIVKLVYTPICMADDYRLIGSNERVKQKYYEYYKRIHLDEKLESIYISLVKYANCVVYLMEDGNIITLPIHYCRIGNLESNGQPLVEFNCTQTRSDMNTINMSTQKDWIKDEQMKVRLRGYPPEIADGIMNGATYVQLNPDNTFVIQDTKEDWMRYAIPFIAGCLIALEKKERISNYEDSLIDLAARSFVHVTYGDDNEQVLPTVSTLSKIANTFKSAMSGCALAVTNHHCKAVVVQPKTDDVFANEKYASVNNDILSAAGVSGIIVNGSTTDGSSFASAQVSSQTVAIRVQRFKDKICELMNKINRRVNVSGGRLAHSAQSQIPEFTYPPVDLSGSKSLQEACKYLFEQGLMSHETLLDSFGVDMMQEVERKTTEESKGIHEVLAPSDKDDCKEKESSGDGSVGRPTLDNSERTSDPEKSATGRLPKASDPQGSNAKNDANSVV